MITLDFVDWQFVLTADDELERSIVKTINAVKADGSKRWTLPAALPCWIEASYVVNVDGGHITEAAQAWWTAAEPVMHKLISLKDETQWQPVPFGAVTLRPDQEADAQFLAAVGSGLILHVPRKGKTNVMLRTLQLRNAYPALIVARDKTTLEMKRQVVESNPQLRVVVLTSGLNATQRKKELAQPADVYILGHKILELHSKLSSGPGLKSEAREKEREKGKYEDKELDLIPLKAVVIDEGHAIQNPNAAITRAGFNLGDKPGVTTRLLLTGTLAPNKETEEWAPIRFCYPHLFPAKTKWIDRYVNMVTNFFGIRVCHGIKPEMRESWDLIFSLMSVRRERGDGAEKEYRVVPVELEKSQLKTYREFAENSMSELGDDLVFATDSMSLRHRLSNVAMATPVVRDGTVVALEMPSAKIDTLFTILEENDDPAIIVVESRLAADLIRAQLADRNYKAVAILGGMTAQDTFKAQQDFQSGAANVIVINKAGSEGVELSRAKRTIFMERSFDLTFNIQAEDRNMSQAQEADVVEVIDIVATGTLDQAVREAFINKDTKLHERLNDVEWVKRSLYGGEA